MEQAALLFKDNIFQFVFVYMGIIVFWFQFH